LALAIAHGEEIMHCCRIFEKNWGSNRKILEREREKNTRRPRGHPTPKSRPPPIPTTIKENFHNFGS
jgi:hypothetical protein